MEPSTEPKTATAPVESASHEPPTDRRDFMQKAACVVLGGAATLVPVAAGVSILASPLLKKGAGGALVRVTSADGLPLGGEPRLFKIVTDSTDAWTRHPSREIGSVFLQRIANGDGPEAFLAHNAACPHVGCAVEFQPEKGGFFCPCHSSLFAKDGKLSSANSPSQRGLDSLRVEVRQGDLWVEFRNFKPGIPEKIALA